MKYGRLIVIDDTRDSKHKVKCLCDCGKETFVNIHKLKSGHTKSCGCLAQENRRNTGLKNKKHGYEGHPLYRLRNGIINRCYNENSKDYKSYCNVEVCKEWLEDVESFINWCLNNGWKKGLYIDRIDNYKGYSPDNCRFVTPKESNRNMKRTIYITYNGETKPLSVFAEELGVNYITLYARIFNYKWTVEEAILGRRIV